MPAPAWAVIPEPLPVANPPVDLVIPADPIPVPAVPPVLVAEIKAPEPIQSPDLEPQFGEAIWVKVFTTELDAPVALEELVADNNKVMQAVTETEWQLLQTDPGNPLAGKLESGYAAPVGPNAASILRRYEFYKYSGDYKAVDHEALPMNSDSHPDPSEIGTYLGAQNAGANLVDPPPAPPPAIILGTTNLPATGTIGVFYTGSSVATGGEGALTWSATGLPTGVSIMSAGTISGMPSAAGTFAAVVLTVKDTIGQTATVNGSVTINPPPDFTVAASTSLTVKRGSPVSNMVTVGALYGFNSSVGLTISGLPKNAKATFTPSSITTGAGSSTLKVTTASTTPRGRYNLTIAAKSGVLSHTMTVSLTVQ